MKGNPLLHPMHLVAVIASPLVQRGEKGRRRRPFEHNPGCILHCLGLHTINVGDEDDTKYRCLRCGIFRCISFLQYFPSIYISRSVFIAFFPFPSSFYFLFP